MKKLFLVSSFIPVADFLPEFLENNLVGKRVSFLSTASTVKKSKFYVKQAKEKLLSWGMIVDDIDVSVDDYETVKEKLEKNDYLFVCGGNPFYLLDQLQKTKTMELIKEQVNQGKVYIGESSGAIILADDIAYIEPLVGPEVVDKPATFKGLNLIDFKVVPHYKLFSMSEKVDEILEKNADLPNLVPITNNQVILVDGQNWEIKTANDKSLNKL